MTARVEFAGLQVAYIVGGLVQSLELATHERDIEMLGHMLDRAMGALRDPLDPDLQARIAKVRTAKGLPA